MRHTETTLDPETPRFLSQESCRAIIAQVRALGVTHAQIDLQSSWRGYVRWGRNRISVASDWRNDTIQLGSFGVATNQLDPESLRTMVELRHRDLRAFPDEAEFHPRDFVWAPAKLAYPATHIWSDRTYAQTPEERETVANRLIEGAEKTGMLSAGFLSVDAWGTTLYTDNGLFLYAPQTVAQCSMTVRDPQGTGSGWAGRSSYDWGRFDAQQLADIALDKCLRSRNPVRVEPGRYTLIMEPQATFDFANVIMRDGQPPFMDRDRAERPLTIGPFQKGRLVTHKLDDGGTVSYDPTKIGEKLLDERLSITFDPLDPDLGVLPFDPTGEPYVPVTWFDKGVLTNLYYDRRFANAEFHQPTGKPNSGAFRMSGGTTTIDEMIATTKRGLIVTRFSGGLLVDQLSMLYTGFTRDGLWLIEDGKISKPVKNMRWTESPLFAFNNVEQLGVPVPIFCPGCPAITPPMKVRDFSFTSLADAV